MVFANHFEFAKKAQEQQAQSKKRSSWLSESSSTKATPPNKTKETTNESDDKECNESFSSRSRKRQRRGNGGNNNHGNKNGNHHTNQHTSSYHKPSPAALALSAQLQEYSRHKQLDKALNLYWNRKDRNDEVPRDEHHACIVIDCCARCGDVIQAEKIVQHLKQEKRKQQHDPQRNNHHKSNHATNSIYINVTTLTAMLKGYAHAGGGQNLHKAMELFREMCNASHIRDRPNVRTLNTLLRGCLWTAATNTNITATSNQNNSHSKNHKNSKRSSSKTLLAGGVITSEQAWHLFCDKVGADSLDSSAYETTITLLCQALRTSEAEARIQEFQTRHNVRIKNKATIILNHAGIDATVLETLATTYLALARAHALCGRSDDMWTACQRALNAAKTSRTLWQSKTGGDDSAGGDGSSGKTASTTYQNKNIPRAAGNDKKRNKQGAAGGKRAWKKHDQQQQQQQHQQHQGNNVREDEQDAKRAASNIAYRTHRLSEIEAEARELCKLRSALQSRLEGRDANYHNQHIDALVKRILTRLFYFSGGGTTDLAATTTTITATIASPSSSSLSSSPSSSTITTTSRESPKSDKESQKHADLSRAPVSSAWASYGLGRLLEGRKMSVDDIIAKPELVGVDGLNDIWKDGRLDFDRVFLSNDKKPIHIELGAGFGDWIVQQAQQDTSRKYVAIELRADRVFHILAKSILTIPQPLDNVAIVGSECGSFLRDRIPHNSVSTVFANFPEPPTQSYGDGDGELETIMGGGPEPAHMLNAATLISAAQCLQPTTDGKIVIVTDNRWYARLLCATLVKVGRSYKGLLRSATLGDSSHAMKNSGLRQAETIGTKTPHPVILWEGIPNEAIGHKKAHQDDSGSSYFDRLWRTGAGSHSERKTRFVIVMHRC